MTTDPPAPPPGAAIAPRRLRLARHAARAAWWAVTPWRMPRRMRMLAAARRPPPAASAAPLDLFDDAAVLAAVNLPRAAVIPPLDAATPVADALGAGRWVLALLRLRADLRARFPHALSEGADGAFARWLAGEAEAGALACPPGLAGQLPALWASDLGARPWQILCWRDDVRAAHPDALSPSGCGGFAGYLFRHAPSEYGLRPEEAWWFLLTTAEDPAARLVQTYRFNAEWQQAHPLGLTVFGQDAFAAFLARTFGLSGRPDWLDPARWPGLPDPADQLRLAYAAHPAWRERHPAALASPTAADGWLRWLAEGDSGLAPPVRAWCAEQRRAGVAAALAAPALTLMAHFCYLSGLRVSAETMADAMEAAGVAVGRRNIPVHQHDEPPHPGLGGLESADVTLIHTQPVDLFLRAHELAKLAERHPRTHRIAYWYWELNEVPPDWTKAARAADEIWTATSFVADALRRAVNVPVLTLFPGVRIGPFTRRPREALGAPARGDGRFAFLFSFHMASVTERKNPLGLLRAFRAAFRPEEPVDLVLKVTSESTHAAELAALRAAAEGANVAVIDRVFTPDETLSLMDACDAYVSLHRAEGLGLTMAEAMLLGKPVIATRYSGNLEFMDDENSLLVDCRIVPLPRPIPPYPAGAHWAEPDEAHAAALMRKLFENQDAAAALGERARRSAEERLSLHAAGERMAARLREIAASRA